MHKITHVMYLKSKNYKYLTMLSNSDLSFNDGLFLYMYKASESLRFRVLRCMSTVVSHIYAYDHAKTLSFLSLIRRKNTEFENESNV